MWGGLLFVWFLFWIDECLCEDCMNLMILVCVVLGKVMLCGCFLYIMWVGDFLFVFGISLWCLDNMIDGVLVDEFGIVVFDICW